MHLSPSLIPHIICSTPNYSNSILTVHNLDLPHEYRPPSLVLAYACTLQVPLDSLLCTQILGPGTKPENRTRLMLTTVVTTCREAACELATTVTLTGVRHWQVDVCKNTEWQYWFGNLCYVHVQNVPWAAEGVNALVHVLGTSSCCKERGWQEEGTTMSLLEVHGVRGTKTRIRLVISRTSFPESFVTCSCKVFKWDRK